MAEAFIVGAVRTPVGRRNGGLSGINPVDLAACALTELMARTGADPSAVAFHASGPVHGFAVSVEHAGGAVQPSRQPVATAPLS